MKWQAIELHCEKLLDCTDRLGNPCYGKAFVKKTFARVTVWNEEDINLIGREITSNDRKFVVRIPFKVFPLHSKTIKAAGSTYDIFKITDLGKFTLVYAKNQKGDANE